MKKGETDLKMERLSSIEVKSLDLSYIERMILTDLLNELILDKNTHPLYVRPIKEDGSAAAFFRNSAPELKTRLLEQIKDKLKV